MSIKVNCKDDELLSLTIDGEDYYLEDDHVIIPIPVLTKQNIMDLPKDCVVEICDSINDNTVICHNVPTTIEIKDDNSIEIIYDETTTRKYWDGPVGLKLVMETKRDIILERHKEIGDVDVWNYGDDGAYISLFYSYTTLIQPMPILSKNYLCSLINCSMR